MEPQPKSMLVQLRNEDAITRVPKPSRPAKARMLGYKAKTGYVIVRVKIGKGGRKKRATHMGRKPSKQGMKGFSTHKSLQLICEERAARKYPNLQVVNSYLTAQDGQSKWFEIILTKMPIKGRAFRGLTHSAKKMRGLLHKGKKKA